MRKLILILILSPGHLFCLATPVSYDTIPNWQILYNGKLIVKGNANGQIEKLVDTVSYKLGSHVLSIFYHSDATDPENKVIEVWSAGNFLTQETFDRMPFEMNLWNILSNKTTGRTIDLEIYYVDDSMQEKKLIGKLTFHFPYRSKGRPYLDKGNN